MAGNGEAPAAPTQPRPQPQPHVEAHPHHRAARILAAVLLGLGVTATVTIHGAVDNAETTVDRFYDRTAFADFVAQGGDAATFATKAARVRGVETVRTRTTATLAIWLGGDKTKVQGTLIGVPDATPGINRLDVTDGRGVDPKSNDAVVERHGADDLGISVGEGLQILGLGSIVNVNVRGVAVSPEYLLPAASQQQIVTAKGSFLVAFVPEALAAQVAGISAVPQVLVRYKSGADPDAVARRLTRLASTTAAALTYTRDDQPSNAILSEERAGFDDAGIVLPGVFLLTGALVVALVGAQTARALARNRGATMAPAARIAAVAGPVGAGMLGGLLAGRVGARLLAGVITDDLALGDAVRDTPTGALLVGFGAAAVAGLLAYALTTLPAGKQHRTSLSLGGLVAVAVTAALALVCVLAPMGVIDSARATIDQAAALERVDAQVSFEGPVGTDELVRLRAVRGVAIAETTPSADVVVAHGTRRYATELEAFSPNTEVQSFEAPDGRDLQLPETGVLIPEALGGILHARPGDQLSIVLTGSGLNAFTLPVAGYSTNTLGNLVFTRTSTLHTALGPNPGLAGGVFNTATLRFADGADPAAIASTVQSLAGVAVYVPVGADIGTVSKARPIFSVLFDVFLAIGALSALLGIAAVVAAATPGASGGLRTGRLVRAVLVGVAIGAVPGVLLGRVAADQLVDALESDLVHLVRTTDSTSVIVGLVVVVAVALATVLGITAHARRPARRRGLARRTIAESGPVELRVRS